MSTIYNSTDGPLIIDRAGRVLGARESRPDVDPETVPRLADHVAAGRMIVRDDPEPAEQELDDAPAKATPARSPRPTKEA